jgi:hypothetical protein
MADVKIAYAASSDLTVTNLHSIATSATLVSGWESAVVDNTTNKYVDYLVSAKITTASSGQAAGLINLYVVPMLDDTNYPGGFDGTESTEATPLDDAGGTAAGAKLLSTATTDATNSQVYYLSAASVAALFGGICPAKFVIFIAHSTGANLAVSGNQVTIKGVYYTVG